MATVAELRRRRASLVRQVHRCRDASEVFAVASERLHDLVSFDASALLGTDPGTGLPTSPTRIDNIDGITRAQCAGHWRHELLAEDVNLFRDLARAERPAAALRASIDDPERSHRYRHFVRPLGFDDELRTVLRVGDGRWGSITLWRQEGSPAFTAEDVEILAALSAPIGEALRKHALPADAPSSSIDGPGVLLFDSDGAVISANDEARQWLAEMPPEPGVDTEHGVMPLWLLIAVFRAGAVRDDLGDGTARTRVRTRHGQWVACHASCMRHADGTAGNVVLVIEPAPAAAVAPIVVEAYDLTAREQQIVHLLARGVGTAEIADGLFLSRHTVRDHVKAILGKAGVSSRGELVAKLFAEFYSPLHDHDLVRQSDG